MYPASYPTLFDDLALACPVFLFVLGVPLFVAWRVRLQEKYRSYVRASMVLFGAPFCAALVGLVVGAAGISARHFGEWRPVREALLRESRAIEERIAPRKRLSIAETIEIQQELRDRNLGFIDPDSGERVSLFLMWTEPPFVGVAFGNGHKALFAPMTMYCLDTE